MDVIARHCEPIAALTEEHHILVKPECSQMLYPVVLLLYRNLSLNLRKDKL